MSVHSEYFSYRGRLFPINVFSSGATVTAGNTLEIAAAVSGFRHVVVGFFGRGSTAGTVGRFLSDAGQIGMNIPAVSNGNVVPVGSIMPYIARTDSGEVLVWSAVTGNSDITVCYITVPGDL